MIFEQGRIPRKLTYSVENRRFARNTALLKKGEFGPKWSYATTSNTIYQK
jgi:hypothetical protein